jgi:ssDNA-binding Zn-finger/Zn-ribbon topoisomerase 1
MATKYYYTITTHSCPNCKKTLRKSNDGWFLIYVFLFIPIGLIALIVKGIARLKKKYTIFKEEIVTCPSCGKTIAIGTNWTRLMVSYQELLSAVMPDLKTIASKKIQCNKYNQANERYSELIGFQFVNKANNKSMDVFVQYAIKAITVRIDNDVFDYEEGSISRRVVEALS